MDSKPSYDLEQRTLKFAVNVRLFVKLLPNTIANIEDSKQLIHSSGSIGANYIEANESLGKKDKVMHMRISRKEAKESIYWLNILNGTNDFKGDNNALLLLDEASELLKIFSVIIEKLK